MVETNTFLGPDRPSSEHLGGQLKTPLTNIFHRNLQQTAFDTFYGERIIETLKTEFDFSLASARSLITCLKDIGSHRFWKDIDESLKPRWREKWTMWRLAFDAPDLEGLQMRRDGESIGKASLGKPHYLYFPEPTAELAELKAQMVPLSTPSPKRKKRFSFGLGLTSYQLKILHWGNNASLTPLSASVWELAEVSASLRRSSLYFQLESSTLRAWDKDSLEAIACYQGERAVRRWESRAKALNLESEFLRQAVSSRLPGLGGGQLTICAKR